MAAAGDPQGRDTHRTRCSHSIIPKVALCSQRVYAHLQKKYSVAKIDSSDTYEKGRPKHGGLSDPRMGTTEKRGGICTTDGSDMVDCPGYFGHIELAKPMYHAGFIKTVIRVLRCVSYHTSKLLVDKVRGLLSITCMSNQCQL